MTLEEMREKKLAEAKTILRALGLPKEQYNDRSGWVLLALANILPQSSWNESSAPLLPTVEIMSFIRENYGKNYAPNSRETIRRRTLHQFEQAYLVERNRDDPSRACSGHRRGGGVRLAAPPVPARIGNHPDLRRTLCCRVGCARRPVRQNGLRIA